MHGLDRAASEFVGGAEAAEWVQNGLREAVLRMVHDGSFGWLRLLPVLEYHKIQPKVSHFTMTGDTRRAATKEFEQVVAELRTDVASGRCAAESLRRHTASGAGVVDEPSWVDGLGSQKFGQMGWQ